MVELLQTGSASFRCCIPPVSEDFGYTPLSWLSYSCLRRNSKKSFSPSPQCQDCAGALHAAPHGVTSVEPVQARNEDAFDMLIPVTSAFSPLLQTGPAQSLHTASSRHAFACLVNVLLRHVIIRLKRYDKQFYKSNWR
ncbi:hypothetical protein EVAR_53614_1 [Eumeta japonica]|uniref:Uncharacterized protein n=1 Tax=Eumeta variegata TaxID=151549 RepID=A0A4C1X0B3_EUMVA|nr:hypothetical protein EVAR_53614_1 [Eumeta japonica]